MTNESRAYAAAHFALELTGMETLGVLRTIEGGGLKADVMTYQNGGIYDRWRQLGKPKFEDIKLQIGMAMSEPFYEWIEQFFTGIFATALEPDEILTEIRIPIPPPRSGGAYVKLERKVGDFATAAAAAQLTLGASGEIERVGIALTAAGPVPVKATAAERFLQKQKPDTTTIAEAARLVGQAATPSADRRGSVQYKREMARVLAARALARATERAGGR